MNENKVADNGTSSAIHIQIRSIFSNFLSFEIIYNFACSKGRFWGQKFKQSPKLISFDIITILLYALQKRYKIVKKSLKNKKR